MTSGGLLAKIRFGGGLRSLAHWCEFSRRVGKLTNLGPDDAKWANGGEMEAVCGVKPDVFAQFLGDPDPRLHARIFPPMPQSYERRAEDC
jgi:hypothetical protein